MEKFNMQNKISKLESWALEKDIDKQKLYNVFQMLTLGKRGERAKEHPIQYPSCYIKDEDARAWHNSQEYPWVNILEKNFEGIKKDALRIFQRNLMNIHPENNDLAGYGTWNTFFFLSKWDKIH